MKAIINIHDRPNRADLIEAWLQLRTALWPDTAEQEHRAEIAQQLTEPSRYAAYLAMNGSHAIGLAEVALRQDYVNGTDTSPVGFLEGIYVAPAQRHTGVARTLLDAVRAWTRMHGCTELASNTGLDNVGSQAAHEALGFVETERVVFYRMRV